MLHSRLVLPGRRSPAVQAIPPDPEQVPRDFLCQETTEGVDVFGGIFLFCHRVLSYVASVGRAPYLLGAIIQNTGRDLCRSSAAARKTVVRSFEEH